MVSVIAFYGKGREGLSKFLEESKEFKEYIKAISKEPVEIDDDLVILVATCGGTARFLAKTAEKCKRFVYIGIPYDNSFASAMSAKEIVDGLVIPLNSFKEIKEIINAYEMAKGFEAIVIGERIKRKHEKVKAKKISFEEIEEIIKKQEIKRDIKEIFEKVFKVRDEFLMKLASFLRGKIFSIDCFNFIEYFGKTPCLVIACCKGGCESDLDALYRLKVSNGFWMANLLYFDEEKEFVAHCTLNCLDCYKKLKVTTHFETGKRYSLKCKLKEMEVTVWDEEIYEGRLEPIEGLFACRTQAKIKRRFVEPKKNHRIIIKGRRGKLLRTVMKIAGN